MKYTKLGKNGPTVSTVGFGAWGISGRDWGAADDDAAVRALHEAIDKGVTFIDTADVYGYGHSEELIARVIREREKRDDLVIATKAGNNFYPLLDKHLPVTPVNHDYSREHLIFAVEQSLKRLGVETLDILQLHSPDTEILERDEPWEVLESLKRSGKIRYAGWSVQSFRETEQAPFLERHHDLLDVIQVRYNLLEREAEKKLFPLAMQYGTGIIVRIPILFGLLAGKFNRETRFPENDHRKINLSPEKLDLYLSQLEKMMPFFEKYDNYTMTQLSLRFCLSHPATHTVIPGMRTVEQVHENIGAAEMDYISYKDFPSLD